MKTPMMRVLLCVGLFALSASCSWGDVVAAPKRIFGLGDLGPAAVSPDKRHLASGGESAAYLWDYETGVVRQRLDGHRSRVTALAFSPDSQRLVTGTHWGVMGIWRLDNLDSPLFLQGHRTSINSISFSPDGRWFVTASSDNNAAVWSVEDRGLVRRVTIPGTSISTAVFTPDGTKLITADNSMTNSVRIWDLKSGETLRMLGRHLSPVSSLAILPDGRLATGGEDRKVLLWNIETGELQATLQGAGGAIRFLLAAPNSTTLFGGCQDQKVLLWDTSTGIALQSWPTEPLSSLALVPESDLLLTASSDLLLRLVDRQSGLTKRAFYGHTTSTTVAVSFSPDGQFVASAGVEKATRLWNRTNATLVRTFEGTGSGSFAAAFSPDGRHLLTTRGLPRKSALLWEVETGQLVREFAGHTDWLQAAAFSPDGSRVATGAQDRTLRVWDTATGQQLHSFNSGGAFVHCVAFSPDGRLVAGGGSSFDPSVRIWEVESGKGVGLIMAEAGTVRAVVFSKSGKELFVGWDEGLIRVLNLETGKITQELFTSGFLGGLTLSPDGELLLVAEGWPSFAARLFEWRTGRLLRSFVGHIAPVDSVAFNASGTQILTGADVVRLWDVSDIAARLRLERRPEGLMLSWNAGLLQQAPAPTGPWTMVAEAVSPWLATHTSPSRFFRVVVEAPQ